MVHLLDPIIFPLDDLNGFRQRIAARQEVAETVAALLSENMLILDGYINSLIDAFPEDILLSAQIESLRTLLNSFPDESDAQFLATLDQLRNSLSETYRLHRRILRNRRKSVPPWITPNRSGLQAWSCQDSATSDFASKVEALRLSIASADESTDTEVEALLFNAAFNPWSRKGYEQLSQRLVNSNNEVMRHLSDLMIARRYLLSEDRCTARLISGLDTLLKGRYQAVIFCGDEDLQIRYFPVSMKGFLAKQFVMIPLFDEDSPVLEWHGIFTIRTAKYSYAINMPKKA